ncbi:Ig heavy chain V-II region ARH-77 [Chelonia mydas]|uniref:Ig heavy chain V-II region ARH-77 n=1 Tax=Chelonia mydas TaxID=8469 RepID=M7AHU3_CHEMY|nr:Ig heavy chain V-II region ARH-77 [Chelonia mydas]
MTQSGLGEVTVSGSLSLTCAISDSAFSGGDWRHWIRQPTGKGLVWLALIDRYGNTHYFPDIQNRATISVDPSKDEFYLRMDSLSPLNTATSYCARSTYQM